MDFRGALVEQTRLFGEIVRGADLATPVPTCPGWTLNQLFRHVGRGNRWAAQIIADRRSAELDPRAVRDGKPPDDIDAAIDWLHVGVQLIFDAVDQVGPLSQVWTFLGPRPAGWWVRRRLHEATVHRADAALALGANFTLPAELAADGVSEWIDVATARGDALHRGQSLHLHAIDDGLGSTGEWTIAHGDDGLAWTHSHAKSDAAVRGPAVGLLLAITRRGSAGETGLEVLGDPTVWDEWLARTSF